MGAVSEASGLCGDTHLFAVIEAILVAVGQIKGVEPVSCFLLLLG